MDRLTKEQRHKNMVANKSKGTQIELLLARALWNSGIRYRKNDKGILGTPDFSLRGYKIAIFCDGDFWHGKDWEINKEKIKSNRSFWYAKIERNIERDRQITEELQNNGWKVFRFWETEIRQHADQLVTEVLLYMHNQHSSKSRVSFSEVTEGQRIPIQLKSEQQLAVVSHYLYNQNLPSARLFEQPAKTIIRGLYDIDEQCSSVDTLVAEPEIQYSLGSNLHTAPFLPAKETRFTFVDLFAGIGGMRIALQDLGGRCVFCSEWDIEAQFTYLLNFGEVPFGDITQESIKQLIPDSFDLLCGSISPQRFLHAGKKKGLDRLSGTLFFHYADILKRTQPKAFLLETSTRIKTLEKGKAINILMEEFKDTLGYYVTDPIVLKNKESGLSDHTERLYIIGFRDVESLNSMTDITNLHQEISRGKGLPDEFIFKVNKTTTHRLLRNASPVMMVRNIGELILNTIRI